MNKIILVLIPLLLIFGNYAVIASSLYHEEMQHLNSSDDAFDMVIISPEIFEDTLQELIDHKNSYNFQTFLKTTEAIYAEYSGRDDPEKIKYFIKDAIETHNISYVLLVGGAAYLPSRYIHIYFDYDYQDYWEFLSDLYYADIYDASGNFSSWDSNENDIFAEYQWYGNTDDLDLYPDVYLGRLACVSHIELTTCINKIITYENGQAWAQNWFMNIVTIGGDSLPGDAEQVDEGEFVNQGVIDNMDGFIPTRVWASNGLLYNADNINDAINQGAGFVFFNGHGNLNIWATHPHESNQWIPIGSYSNSHVDSLTNQEMLPIIVSDACYHSTYDVAADCFGWNFITNPNGGAIGFLGSTDIDVSHPGEAIITKGIEKLCIEMSHNYMNGDTTLGELWGHGITTYLDTAEMDEMDYITIEEFQLFGDPSLIIASTSQKPFKPERPEGPSSGLIKTEYTYSSSTTDPDEDELYYLFDWDDNSSSEWIGPYASGETAQASHQWEKQGEYNIRVKARDIHGKISEWSDPLPINMPRNKKPDKLIIEKRLFFEHLSILLRLIESNHHQLSN